MVYSPVLDSASISTPPQKRLAIMKHHGAIIELHVWLGNLLDLGGST